VLSDRSRWSRETGNLRLMTNGFARPS